MNPGWFSRRGILFILLFGRGWKCAMDYDMGFKEDGQAGVKKGSRAAAFLEEKSMKKIFF